MKRSDPHGGLRRALTERAGHCHMLASRSTAWSSLTFTGARHVFQLRVNLRSAERYVEGLDECDFCLPGHILADISIAKRQDQGETSLIEIEALTVEEG